MVISCLLPVLYIEAVSGYVLGREVSGIIIMIIQQRIRKVISEVLKKNASKKTPDSLFPEQKPVLILSFNGTGSEVNIGWKIVYDNKPRCNKIM